MKTILVATDYSEPASNAMNYAALLAQKTGAELILLNVYKLSIHASNSLASNSSIEHLIKKSEGQLIELALETEDRYKIKVGYELGQDDTIDSLKAYIDTHSVDLVVMGIESNLIEYKWFGNTTTAAIGLMKFPLLVVPNDIPFNGIDRIMYACEPSYLKDNCELGTLKYFVKEFDAKLEVFHVLPNDADKANKEKLETEKVMDRILLDVKHTYRYVSNSKVDDGIVEGLEEVPADLLVMIPHRPTFFESLFKGSQTNQMTVKTRIPLLVIPNEQAC